MRKLFKWGICIAPILSLLACDYGNNVAQVEIELIDAPFSRDSGAHAFPPDIIGWQCNPENIGIQVATLNGYSMHFLQSAIPENNGNGIVSVKPDNWPCVFQFFSQVPTESFDGRGPLLELVSSTSYSSGDYAVFSNFPSLDDKVVQEVRICRESNNTIGQANIHQHCVDEIVARYQGKGVVYQSVLAIPHGPPRIIWFMMEDYKISIESE